MCPLESRHQWHQAGTGQHWRSLRTETGGRRAQGRPARPPPHAARPLLLASRDGCCSFLLPPFCRLRLVATPSWGRSPV